VKITLPRLLRSRVLAWSLCALAVQAALSASAHAQCGPGAGPCDEVHETPGCFGIECCGVVCTIAPSCCDTTWDAFCVELAKSECDDIPCPGEEDCFTPHLTTACIDEACCNATCRFDPFCCYGPWDPWCVTEALTFCDATPCVVTIPKEAVAEVELCTERLNDGCNMAEPAYLPVACGAVITGTGSTRAPRDTDWYALTLEVATTVTISLTPEFPAEVIIVRGPCSRTQSIANASTEACTSGTFAIDLPPGEWYVVFSSATTVRPMHSGVPCPDKDPETEPGFFGNRYVATIECAPSFEAADLNQDGIVDGADLGILLAAWGTSGPGDLDGSGTVDGADLGVLLAEWG